MVVKALETVANTPVVIPANGSVPEIKLAPTLARRDWAVLRNQIKGARLPVVRASGLAPTDPAYLAALTAAIKAPITNEEWLEFLDQDEGWRFLIYLHGKAGGMKIDYEDVMAWEISPSLTAEINAVLFPEPPAPKEEGTKSPLASEGGA